MIDVRMLLLLLEFGSCGYSLAARKCCDLLLDGLFEAVLLAIVYLGINLVYSPQIF